MLHFGIKSLLKRMILMTIGLLIIMAIGVSLSKIAGLGTSPIASIPNVISLLTTIKLGLATFLFLLFLILLELLVLKNKFRLYNLIQIIPAVIFGFGIDVFVKILKPISPHSYVFKFLFTLISIIILAIGVYLEVHSKLFVMPGEGLAIVLSSTLSMPFSKMKILVDSSMITGALLISFVFSFNLLGVREGTIISAILTGQCVALFEHNSLLSSTINKYIE